MKLPASIKAIQSSSLPDKDRLIIDQRAFFENSLKIEDALLSHKDHEGDEQLKDAFMSAISRLPEGYISTIKRLDESTVNKGTAWLLSILSAFPKPF
jgi:hypothetical protein